MTDLPFLPPRLMVDLLRAGRWPAGVIQNHRIGSIVAEFGDIPIEFNCMAGDNPDNIEPFHGTLDIRQYFELESCRVLRTCEYEYPIDLPYIDGEKVFTIGVGGIGDDLYVVLDYSQPTQEPRVVANLITHDVEDGRLRDIQYSWICIGNTFDEFWRLIE